MNNKEGNLVNDVKKRKIIDEKEMVNVGNVFGVENMKKNNVKE
jgi:hypothetical protein